MNGCRYRHIWILLFALLFALGGVLLWHYSIRSGRAYAESVYGVIFPPSAANIQTRRSGLGYKGWGTDNYIVSVFRMSESEFDVFAGRLPIVTRYSRWHMDYYPWPIPYDGFRVGTTQFRGKHAMIDFSSPAGEGLRCYVWETDQGLFVRLTTAFF